MIPWILTKFQLIRTTFFFGAHVAIWVQIQLVTWGVTNQDTACFCSQLKGKQKSPHIWHHNKYLYQSAIFLATVIFLTFLTTSGFSKTTESQLAGVLPHEDACEHFKRNSLSYEIFLSIEFFLGCWASAEKRDETFLEMGIEVQEK